MGATGLRKPRIASKNSPALLSSLLTTTKSTVYRDFSRIAPTHILFDIHTQPNTSVLPCVSCVLLHSQTRKHVPISQSPSSSRLSNLELGNTSVLPCISPALRLSSTQAKECIGNTVYFSRFSIPKFAFMIPSPSRPLSSRLTNLKPSDTSISS